MFRKATLLFNTVKYLKISQIWARIRRKVFRPTIDVSTSTPKVSKTSNELKPVIHCQQKMFGKNSFRFLNVDSNIISDTDWNSVSQQKLWLYNLHYFDDLTAINSEQRIDWHKKLIQRWIDENPISIGNGWEAYPSSLRIVNWIKWSLLGNSLEQGWADSLAIQTRFISKNLETHLLGNHMFANAKALIFSGLFFKGKEANDWYRIGTDLINIELPEQILKDGGNFELSPMYHAIFLEDLLDIVNIHQAYNKDLSGSIKNRIPVMFRWLEVMCHPDGDFSFFNDTAFSVAPSLQQLKDYSKRLDIVTENTIDSLTYLNNSGYIRVQKENVVAILDVAQIGPDYIPGHGHADVLSFELSLFGERVVVNSGTSTYETNALRHKQRSTISHSTIEVDGKNSSEVWSGFRVARRAKVFSIGSSEEGNDAKVSACHSGYQRLRGSPTHCREWNFSENSLEIIDSITGNSEHKVKAVLPLHPDIELTEVKKDSVKLQVGRKQVNIKFIGSGILQIVSSKYYPEFGLSIDNVQLLYDYNNHLPFKLTTRISW
jgi:uncharacterized heparinase superfamily protein